MGQSSVDGSGGRFTLPRPLDHWYIACRSGELGARPMRRMLFGKPLALFRDAGGRPAALLDRCSHRNVPLSAGRVAGNEVECAYHGWRFGRDGRCCAIPALVGLAEGKARRPSSTFSDLTSCTCFARPSVVKARLRGRRPRSASS
ncbi:MAG: Rieske 2Fe-2S domain-containing protein [Myxococcota bacterium]